MSIKIYYDGACPFCASYTSLLRLRKAAGVVEMIDLRHNEDRVELFYSNGLDPDKGMIVEIGSMRFSGADALWVLATLDTPSTVANQLNFHLLRFKMVARFMYPIMRLVRAVSLAALKHGPLRAD